MIENYAIPKAIVSDLKSRLDYEAFGVAIALICLHLDTGKPISDDDKTHKALKLHLSRWKRLRGDIAPLFEADATGKWEHPGIAFWLSRGGAHHSEATDDAFFTSRRAKDGHPTLGFSLVPSLPQRRKKSVKTPLQNPGSRIIFAPREVPAAEALPPASAARVSSLDNYAFELGIELFSHLGTERARRLLGSMLRDYSVPFLVRALESARERKGSLADPVSWVKKSLLGYPTKEEERRQRFAALNRFGGSDRVRREVEKNPDVKPELVDVSEGAARRLKKLSNLTSRSMFSFDDPKDPET